MDDNIIDLITDIDVLRKYLKIEHEVNRILKERLKFYESCHGQVITKE